MMKLLEIKRNNIAERTHFGFVGLYDKSFGFVAPQYKNEIFYLRSSAKPIQASVLDSLGGIEAFALSDEEIAVICSSHTGSQFHVNLVKNILIKADVPFSALKCGVHVPLDKSEALYLEQNNQKPNKFQNNCSGKHAGFLAGCRLKGFDIENYLDFNHPLQKMVKECIFEYCGLPYKNEIVSKDGCNAPIWAMPLQNMAQGFLRCFENHPKIKNAMKKAPYAAGGHKRIDSEIIMASKGNLIAKVGAEGLLMIYNEKKHQVLVIKVLDSSEQARAITTINGLLELKWMDIDAIEKTPLVDFYNLEIKTHSNEKVGCINNCFDWNLLK